MRWLASLIVITAIITACHMPHEIFGWKTPMRLETICHVWEDLPAQRTMMFNHPMAGRHLKHHKSDYAGECQ